MMKKEFEERLGAEVSEKNYRIIEIVYNWHPAVASVNGKDQIVELYKIGGMSVINGMVEAAVIIRDLEEEERKIKASLRKIQDRIERVNNGDFELERCKNEAEQLLEISENPCQWEKMKKFLENKYGEETAREVLEEVGR